MSADDLQAEFLLMQELGAAVVEATDIGSYAIELAARNWAVFPLRGKVPAIPNPHPKGSTLRQRCKGECGLPGHGVLDATTDPAIVSRWWGHSYVGANIGCRVPGPMIVVDVDPRHGGHNTLAALEDAHGPLPETLTTISGRGDGGRHLFFRRPTGTLSGKRLGPGIDLKTSTGYVVMPPSIHPDTGLPYTRLDRPVAAPPAWLTSLLQPEPVKALRSTRRLSFHAGPSIADQFSGESSWSDVLTPHGWRCLDADPDGDGARWLHPAATSDCSATVRNGCLFAYSTNTPFDVTEPGDPKGYTKFRAYAVLDHGGDLKAAARFLAKQVIS